MESKSKNEINVKLIIIVAVLLMISLAFLGFGYAKYTNINNKYDELDNKYDELDKKYNEVNSKYSEAAKTIENQNKTISENAGKNDYSLFVKKMKEERKRLANSKNLEVNFSDARNDIDDIDYGINLEDDGVLYVLIGEKNKKKVIAKNVLFYRLVNVGNGGYRKLCYVTEDGFVYVANIEEAISEKTSIKSVKQKEAKEIVNILPGSSNYVDRDNNGNVIARDGGGANPFFVDINGNIYLYSFE